jgi:hypothetical protein
MHLHRIRPVVEHDGPFLSLHVDVGRTTEDATQQREARWTSIRHELERLDAAAALVEDVRERLDQNTHISGEARRTIVLADGEVVFDGTAAQLHSAVPGSDRDDFEAAFVRFLRERGH